MKRILAFIGVGLLVGMYLMTLVFALSGSENYWGMLMGSVSATIIIPVVLYAYNLVYRLLKDRRAAADRGSEQTETEAKGTKAGEAR